MSFMVAFPKHLLGIECEYSGENSNFWLQKLKKRSLYYNIISFNRTGENALNIFLKLIRF